MEDLTHLKHNSNHFRSELIALRRDNDRLQEERHQRVGVAPDQRMGVAADQRMGVAADQRMGVAAEQRMGVAPDQRMGVALSHHTARPPHSAGSLIFP